MAVGAGVAVVAAQVDRRAVGAVVLHGQPVDVPRTERARARADRDVDVALARQRLRRRGRTIERQHDKEPPLRVSIVIARRIGDGRPERRRHCRAAHGGRIAIKRIEIDDSAQRIPGGVLDAQDGVDGGEHVAVAHAKSLVRRLDRELVAAVRQALLTEIDAVEADAELRVRLRLFRACCRAAGADRPCDAAVGKPLAMAQRMKRVFVFAEALVEFGDLNCIRPGRQCAYAAGTGKGDLPRDGLRLCRERHQCQTRAGEREQAMPQP